MGHRKHLHSGFVLLIVLVAWCGWQLGAPRASLACGCCACDFGNGNILCGVGDGDCGECIVLGGIPADSCEICSDVTECDEQTLCAGDQQECSTDISGGCCVGTGCFIETQLGCSNVAGRYRGDGTDCAGTPCAAAAAPALSNSAVWLAVASLVAIGVIALRRRRA